MHQRPIILYHKSKEKANKCERLTKNIMINCLTICGNLFSCKFSCRKIRQTPFKTLTKAYSIRYNTLKGKGADTVAFALFRFYERNSGLKENGYETYFRLFRLYGV